MCIVSYSRNFIFIKTTKTAGTSIEVMLERLCSGGDIVTPISPPNEEHYARNYERLAILRRKKIRFYNHMPASEVRSKVGRFFDNAFKFCFERHPIDKCLSHYAMLRNSPHHQKSENPIKWEQYLERGDFPIDVEKYTDIRGSLLVNKLYKYERLEESLSEVFSAINVSSQPLNIFEKSGYRYDVPTFDEVNSSQDQRSIIFQAFSETLKFVDYD